MEFVPLSAKMVVAAWKWIKVLLLIRIRIKGCDLDSINDINSINSINDINSMNNNINSIDNNKEIY